MSGSIGTNTKVTNKKSDDKVVNLVADIGGTNLRIGITLSAELTVNLQVYKCSEYESLAEIIADYIERYQLSEKVVNACLAIACPVDQDLIEMTNLPWSFYKSHLKKSLNLNHLLMINDYTAIAYAVPLLSAEQKVKIGEGDGIADKPISICGPGTGLGVANIVFNNKQCISISGEGGHVDFAPTDETEIAILQCLLSKYPHVSYEQLLSGMGIEQIYQSLCNIEGHSAQSFSAAQISDKALNNSCELCLNTLQVFCKILGSFAGNLALTMASFGGVYIAGGIVPRFIEFLQQSEFRQAFEAKGRFSGFNKKIATFVITEQQPGIIGASAYLHQQLVK